MLLELGVDLVDPRLSHIANFTQIGIGLVDQLTNVVDANALQDVVGPNGEVELLEFIRYRSVDGLKVQP